MPASGRLHAVSKLSPRTSLNTSRIRTLRARGDLRVRAEPIRRGDGVGDVSRGGGVRTPHPARSRLGHEPSAGRRRPFRDGSRVGIVSA